MSTQAFQALLADFFRAPGTTHSQVLAGAGRCRYVGLEVAVYYDDRSDPSNVHAYIDFGAVAPVRQRDVYRTLLSRPSRFRQTHSAVVGLDCETNRIVLVARIALDQSLSGSRMADIVKRLIKEVDLNPTSPPPAQRRPALQPAAGGCKASVRFASAKARAARRPS